MAKRHPSLVPLTHDHHHVLAAARRAGEAARSGDETQVRDQAASFLELYRSEILLHFREEEEVVFPLLLDRYEMPPELLIKVLSEHEVIHNRMHHLATEPSAELLKEVSELFQAHIRLEEKQVFPLVEEAVPAADLDRIELAPRDRSTN